MKKITLDEACKLIKLGQKVRWQMLTDEALEEWKETLRFLCEEKKDVFNLTAEDVEKELNYQNYNVI